MSPRPPTSVWAVALKSRRPSRSHGQVMYSAADLGLGTSWLEPPCSPYQDAGWRAMVLMAWTPGSSVMKAGSTRIALLCLKDVLRTAALQVSWELLVQAHLQTTCLFRHTSRCSGVSEVIHDISRCWTLPDIFRWRWWFLPSGKFQK